MISRSITLCEIDDVRQQVSGQVLTPDRLIPNGRRSGVGNTLLYSLEADMGTHQLLDYALPDSTSACGEGKQQMLVSTPLGQAAAVQGCGDEGEGVSIK